MGQASRSGLGGIVWLFFPAYQYLERRREPARQLARPMDFSRTRITSRPSGALETQGKRARFKKSWRPCNQDPRRGKGVKHPNQRKQGHLWMQACMPGSPENRRAVVALDCLVMSTHSCGISLMPRGPHKYVRVAALCGRACHGVGLGCVVSAYRLSLARAHLAPLGLVCSALALPSQSKFPIYHSRLPVSPSQPVP